VVEKESYLLELCRYVRQVALYGRRGAGEALPAIARRMGVSDRAVSRRVSAVARRQGGARVRERLASLSDGQGKT